VSITSNEQHVRLEIFEGRLPLDDAGQELIRLAQAQLAAEVARHDRTHDELLMALKELSRLWGCSVSQAKARLKP
jgi:hypothetical protein